MKKKHIIIILLLIANSLSAQLVLNEAFFEPDDSAGLATDANGDGFVINESDDEFIEFVNASTSSLDISGYQIFDEISLRHIVPAGTIIPAGEIYVVFGGGDVSAINNISGVIAHTASTGALDLTDAGDVITVTDSSNNTILTFDCDALYLGLSFDFVSASRSPHTTGKYQHHYSIDGTPFSPGILSSSTFTNSTPLVLNEINFDPSEDANGDGTFSTSEDEFIEIYNNSDTPFDISGYTFSDMSSFRLNSPDHVVPNNTIIPAKGVYLLFGGGIPTGDFGSNTVVQTSNGTSSLKLGLTNSGDVLFIKNAIDEVVIVFDSAEIDAGDNQSITRSPDITGDFRLHGDTYLELTISPGKKANEDTLSFETNNYTVGQSYFGADNYIEYIPGDLPIIIVAPHDGALMPFSLATLTDPRGNDNGTAETTQLLNTYLNTKTNGGTPHVIINNLNTSYLNPATDIDDGAGSQTATRNAYKEFHDFIEDAKSKVTQDWGKGHYIEIHGNGGTDDEWNEIGVGVSDTYLNGTDEDILGRLNVSSLKNLATNGGIDFLQIVKGPASFGSLLQGYGWKSTPSQVNPKPGNNTFFFSGYNVQKHGSRYGGSIDATHLESYFVFMQSANRDQYTNAVAESLLTFMLNYGFDLRNNRFPLSVENEALLDQIVLYPNPSESENGVSLKGINYDTIENIKIYNITGSQVLNVKKDYSKFLTNVKSGVYFVRISMKNGSYKVKKVIIK